MSYNDDYKLPDTDCFVPEKVHMPPREGIFGLNLLPIPQKSFVVKSNIHKPSGYYHTGTHRLAYLACLSIEGSLPALHFLVREAL